MSNFSIGDLVTMVRLPVEDMNETPPAWDRVVTELFNNQPILEVREIHPAGENEEDKRTWIEVEEGEGYAFPSDIFKLVFTI